MAVAVAALSVIRIIGYLIQALHVLQELKERTQAGDEAGCPEMAFNFETEQGAHCTVKAPTYKLGAPAVTSYNITADSADQQQLEINSGSLAHVSFEPQVNLDSDLGSFDAHQHKSLLV